MGSTKVTDAVSALVTVLDAALTPPVFDSFALTAQQMDVFVIVGNADDPDSVEAATYSQDWSNQSMGTRYEVGSIACLVVAQSGGDDFAALRVTVRDTANAVDTALRANLTLSGAVLRADYGTAGVLKQEANPEGINVRLTFTVNYQVAA
jgi:hypothetical protein